jgi:hypothetical protein
LVFLTACAHTPPSSTCDVPDSFSACDFTGRCFFFGQPPGACGSSPSVQHDQFRGRSAFLLRHALRWIESSFGSERTDRLLKDTQVVVAWEGADAIAPSAAPREPPAVEVAFFRDGKRVFTATFNARTLEPLVSTTDSSVAW